jgi:hypothetical protein
MSTRQKRTYDVFISYRVEDAANVRAVVCQLVLSGLRVWLDEEEILLADDEQLDKKLKDAIDNSEYALIFASPGYRVSKYCIYERDLIYKCLAKSHVIEVDLSKHVVESRLGVQLLLAKNLNEILEDVETAIGHEIEKVEIEEEKEFIFADKWSGQSYHFDATGWQVASNQCQLIKQVNGKDVIMSLHMHTIKEEKMMDDLRMRKQNHRTYQGELVFS